MTMTDTRSRAGSTGRAMLNKVPEVTAWFWIIKVLSTTVGETFADYLNVTLGFGLTNTTWVMTGVFLLALAVQFALRRYAAPAYWLTVVLISVVGTLITDNLTDGLGVPLLLTTPVFAVALAACFWLWHRSEGTLSIHTIFTPRREAWYWLAILFTFALGTAAGDLIAEQFSLGYGVSLALFVAAIALVAVAYFRFHINAVLGFWMAYVLTRPLGASIGDLMSSPRQAGGLGVGTTTTSYLFLGTILVIVVYLTVTRADVQEGRDEALEPDLEVEPGPLP
ncbi:MAG: COG4705 family protein [Marmoricola sp.]